jgi:molybdate transport system ATP-binding protein
MMSSNSHRDHQIHGNICVKKDNFTLDVSIRFPLNGVTGIFGHSGAGKTTLLRAIAGLEVFEGDLFFGDNCWNSDTIVLPAHQRAIGYVFQDAGLFPHLSVAGNLHFAEKRAMDTPIISFNQAIDLFSIRELLDKKPAQLSGGEKQRVAIARALLIAPKILLLDEPLASLGASHKEEIIPYLEGLKAGISIPMLYVSHDMDEIARLSDHILLLGDGKKIAEGPIHQVTSQLDVVPDLVIDAGVVLEGLVKSIHEKWGLAEASFANQTLWLKDNSFTEGETVRVRILAKDVSVSNEKPALSSILNQLHGQVIELLNDKSDKAVIHLKVCCEDDPMQFVIATITKKSLDALSLSIGSNIWLQIKSVAVIS